MKTKVCLKCGKRKNLNHFAKNKKKKDGIDIYCKECIKQYKDKNKEIFLKYAKEYRQSHQKQIKAYQKKYRLQHRKYFYDWKKEHPDEVYNSYLKKYGITLKEYKKLLKRQNNVCAICKQPETQLAKGRKKIRQLSVDHNHNTTSVRGLLCDKCNRGLGVFRDNPKFLINAAKYLISSIKKETKNVKTAKRTKSN